MSICAKCVAPLTGGWARYHSASAGRTFLVRLARFIHIMLIRRKSIEAQANTKAGPNRRRQQLEADASKPRKIKYAPVTLSELEGVRYLHFGTEWVQGAMRIRKPDWIELEYAQQMMAWMLFNRDPRHIVQLGLGTGALTKFSYRQFAQAQVTAVELNPAVITICHSMFKLPEPDERLMILESDAMDFIVHAASHSSPAGLAFIVSSSADSMPGMCAAP